LTFALIGHLLDAIFYDILAKGQTCSVVIRVHLRIEDSLFRLEKLKTQFRQRSFGLFLRREGIAHSPVREPPQHDEVLLSLMLVFCHGKGYQSLGQSVVKSGRRLVQTAHSSVRFLVLRKTPRPICARSSHRIPEKLTYKRVARGC